MLESAVFNPQCRTGAGAVDDALGGVLMAVVRPRWEIAHHA